MSEQEYIVSLNRDVDFTAFNQEMISLTGAGFIPNRTVEIANARPGSQRNTHYFLTTQEVDILKQDNRVYGVELRPDLRDDIQIGLTATQNSNFNKNIATTGDYVNWGLRRMISATNPYVGVLVTGGFGHTLSGAGVDIVIQDSGIQADHPEFLDGLNTNRVQQIDWYQSQSVVSGTMPSNHYTDYDGHGTHVAGIAAGKTYGWGKNSRIYAVKVAGLEGTADPGTGIPISDCFDVIKEWHKAKPIDPTTGVKRPTVVNMSWGYSLRYAGITGGSYQGIPWTGNQRDTLKGMTGSYDGFGYRHNVRVASVDTDVQELIDAGVHVCIAAGNSTNKIDIATGNDYNNYYTNSNGNYYYHRGSSPYDTSAHIVGSIDSAYAPDGSEKVSAFSCRGPGVSINAPGSYITSTTSNTNKFTSGTYPQNTDYKTANISGTSMASPQIAGILSTYLELNPGLTTAQGLAWINDNAKTGIIYDPVSDINNYTSNYSLFGGENRFAFQSYSDPNVLAIAGSVSSEEGAEAATPTYVLTSSASGVDEGGTFTITLTTANLVNGSIIPYTITGVSATDIGGASLTGNFIVGVVNSITIQVTEDNTFDDGTETFVLTLDSIADTFISVTIADTSRPNPTYFLGTNLATVDEGGTIIFTLTTSNVAAGTSLAYTITGVSSADIGGESLNGTFVVGTTDSLTVTATADETSEGQETMTLALDNSLATASVVINDTSTVAASYTLSCDQTNINEGGQFTVSLAYENGVNGVQIPWTITGVSASDVVGNVLTGNFIVGSTETATIEIANDLTTDGEETLQFTLNNYPTTFIQVVIADTSLDIVSGTTQFTTAGSGTFVVPAGVTNIGFMGIGGGGAGPGSAPGSFSSGGGGGAIGFKNNITVTPGDVISFSVGAGGSGSSGNGSNTSITVNSITYTAGGGIAGASGTLNGTTAGTLLQTGSTSSGGNVSGAWDGSSRGGDGGSSYRMASPNTEKAAVGGGGGAGGMGEVGGKGSPQTVLSEALGQAAPAEAVVDGGIGAGSGGGHGWTQDWTSGTGSVSGGRGGGVTVTLGRSGLGGLKPTTVIPQTITGAGIANNGSGGNPGNVVGTALNSGAGGGGTMTHALASIDTGANSGITGAVMFTWPGNIAAYQFQAPNYTLTSNKSEVFEGTSFTTTLTSNLTVTNTLVPYTITGVSSADLGNESLTGTLTPTTNTKTFNVTADDTVDGEETFVMATDNGATSVSVVVNDSSTGLENQYSSSVVSAGTAAYSFTSGTDRNGSFTGNNPYIVLNTNDTMTFNVNASGHPFYIKTAPGTGTGNLVPDVPGNGTQVGAVTYTPRTAGKTYYQCSIHSLMNGTIYTNSGFWASSTDYTLSIETVVKVAQDSLDNTIAISYALSNGGVYTYSIYKLNMFGDLVWRKTMPVDGWLTSFVIDQTDSNVIYAVGGVGPNWKDGDAPTYTSGMVYSKGIALKIDATGATQWINSYAVTNGDVHTYFTDINLTTIPAGAWADTVILDVIGVNLDAVNGPSVIDQRGSSWHRLNPTNGQDDIFDGAAISANDVNFPAVIPTNQFGIRFEHIEYKSFSAPNAGNFYYIAGTHLGRSPQQVSGLWVQQKDKIFVRIYEMGSDGIPVEYKEVTFENKDETTDIVLAGMDVADEYTVQEEVEGVMTDVIKSPGIVIALNDTSSGKGEIFRIQHQANSITQRIGVYDSSVDIQKNVLTDIKIDGTKIYISGQQKEDNTSNDFTPYTGALNAFYATIDIDDLTTADSRLLLSSSNTFMNSIWVDKTASSVTKAVVGGQANPSAKLGIGNGAQYVAVLPIGSKDHYGTGQGNQSTTVSQTYEDWAIAKTGFVEARTAEESNFSAVIYNSWADAESTLRVPTGIVASSNYRTHTTTSLPALSTASSATTYKMALEPYSLAVVGDPTYVLTSNATIVNEGSAVTFTLTTTNVTDTTNIPYTITGISTNDIGGTSLTGNFTVSGNTASLTLTLTADAAAEGEETLTVTLDGLSVSRTITINDSSSSVSGSQTYYSPGTNTFTVPDGVTTIDIVAVGGGGGGATGRSSAGSASGAGGGGLAYVNNLSVSPGDAVTVIIGSAGVNGSITVDSPLKFVDVDINANVSYTPAASTITDATNGGASIIRIGADVVITANGGTASTLSAGAGGTFTTNSSYGTTRGGAAGSAGVTATESGASKAGGGGGAAGYDTTASAGGGGLGGLGLSEFYRSTGAYPADYYKAGAGGRGGGVELHGKGTNGTNGTAAPGLVASTSPLSFNYSGGTNGTRGSNSADATISVGGGAGGGAGGRIRYQQLSGSYYKWFLNGTGTSAQAGGVRIQWGLGDYP